MVNKAQVPLAAAQRLPGEPEVYRLAPHVQRVTVSDITWLYTERKMWKVPARFQSAVEFLRHGATETTLRDRCCCGQDARPLINAMTRASLLVVTEDFDAFRGTAQERQLGYFAAYSLWPNDAQRRLRSARVALVGVGGIGAVVLQHLLAAGVRELVMIDSDIVERSNLNRQVIYSASDLGRPKVIAACDFARRHGAGDMRLQAYQRAISAPTDLGCLDDAPLDLLVGAADLPKGVIEQTLADYAASRRVAWMSAASGISTAHWGPLIAPGRSPCWRCFQQAWHPAATLRHGVPAEQLTITPWSLGAINTTIAALAARDCVDWLAGSRDPASLSTRISVDLDRLTFTRTGVPPCPHTTVASS